jgi:hypothetical protein
MSKKKGTTDGPATIIGVILIILYAVATYILMFIPVAIGLVIIFFWIKWKISKSKYPNKIISDFWLDKDEIDRFELLDSNLRIAQRNVKALIEQGNAEGISKNKDGSFSSRSKRGKEINAGLSENQGYIDNNIYEYDDLKETPYSKWFSLRKMFINFNSFIGVFSIWVASFIYFFIKDVSSSLSKVVDIANYYFGDLAVISDMGDNWESTFTWVLVYASLISVLGYFIGRVMGSVRFKAAFEEPPLVNIDNLKSY